jgi:hypothetical protein
MINEDDEDIHEQDYLSDSSSSSMLSLKRKYLNFNIGKLMDKLEPTEELSQVGSKYYQHNVNEPIEEEISDSDDMEKEHRKRSSKLSSFSSASSNQRARGKPKGENFISVM